MHIQELENVLKNQSVNVIDVRGAEMFENGHIAGAVNMPLEELETRMSELNKEETYYVVCTKGIKSQKAVDILVEKGYNAINVEGGMSELSGDRIV